MISVEELLAPVPGEAPEGADLHNPSRKPVLNDLIAAGRAARDSKKPGDWAAVERRAEAVLAEHSKDLLAAAWLAEALAYTEGFAGLAAGGELIAGLVGRFWDTLYPGPPADEPAITPEQARLEPLSLLAGSEGRLLWPVRSAVLFTLGDGTAFRLSDCRDSRAWSAKLPAERDKLLKSLSSGQGQGFMSEKRRAEFEASPGARLWETVRAAARSDCADELAGQRAAVTAARDAWRKAQTALDEQAGEGDFSAAGLIELLDDVLRIFAEIVPVAAPAATPDLPGTPAAAALPRLDSREEALLRLAEITRFLRRLEPFSPLAFTLEETLRRARLSWPDLLAEVVPDKAEREAILAQLGIRPNAAGAEPAPPAATPAAPPPASRDEALHQLGEVAAFLRGNEPHLAHALEEAIRRARLSWPDLLAEVVPDKGRREAILGRLGVPPEPGPGSKQGQGAALDPPRADRPLDPAT